MFNKEIGDDEDTDLSTTNSLNKPMIVEQNIDSSMDKEEIKYDPAEYEAAKKRQNLKAFMSDYAE